MDSLKTRVQSNEIWRYDKNEDHVLIWGCLFSSTKAAIVFIE